MTGCCNKHEISVGSLLSCRHKPAVKHEAVWSVPCGINENTSSWKIEFVRKYGRQVRGWDLEGKKTHV